MSRSVFAAGVSGKPLEEQVERSLRSAALWDEVKDRLRQPAYNLSVVNNNDSIARALATHPEMLLFDEPTSFWINRDQQDRGFDFRIEK